MMPIIMIATRHTTDINRLGSQFEKVNDIIKRTWIPVDISSLSVSTRYFNTALSYVKNHYILWRPKINDAYTVPGKFIFKFHSVRRSGISEDQFTYFHRFPRLHLMLDVCR